MRITRFILYWTICCLYFISTTSEEFSEQGHALQNIIYTLMKANEPHKFNKRTITPSEASWNEQVGKTVASKVDVEHNWSTIGGIWYRYFDSSNPGLARINQMFPQKTILFPSRYQWLEQTHNTYQKFELIEKPKRYVAHTLPSESLST